MTPRTIQNRMSVITSLSDSIAYPFRLRYSRPDINAGRFLLLSHVITKLGGYFLGIGIGAAPAAMVPAIPYNCAVFENVSVNIRFKRFETIYKPHVLQL